MPSSVLACLLAPGLALAQQAAPYASAGGPRVAIMRFDGREAALPPQKPLLPEETAACVYRFFQEQGQRERLRYQVLPPEKWMDAARQKTHGHGQEVQRIAEALQADLVVGGWLEPAREGRAPFRLTLALYSNWADPLGQVPIALWSRDCDTNMIRGGAAPLLAHIQQALGLSPLKPPANGTAQTPPPQQTPPQQTPSQQQTPRETPPQQQQPPPQQQTRQEAPPPRQETPPPRQETLPDDNRPVAQSDDREVAPLNGELSMDGSQGLVPLAAGSRGYLRRQPWRELFSLQVGYLFSWRRFTDSGGAGFNVPGSTSGVPGANGLALGAEIYPLAAATSVPLAAAGLGMRLSVLLPFWSGAVEKNSSGGDVGSYSISELRIDWGFLRWHWNAADKPLRPEIILEGLYGYHRFDFTAAANSSIVLPLPGAIYQYIGGDIGLRMHFPYRVAAHISFGMAGLLDLGPMSLPGTPAGQTPGQARGFLVYGPGGGYLWRLDGGITVPVWRRLGLDLSGFYEHKALSFDGTGDVIDPNTKAGVKSASDESAGFMASVRYWY